MLKSPIKHFSNVWKLKNGLLNKKIKKRITLVIKHKNKMAIKVLHYQNVESSSNYSLNAFVTKQ